MRFQGSGSWMMAAAVSGILLGYLALPRATRASNYDCATTTGSCPVSGGWNCFTAPQFCVSCGSGCAGATGLAGQQCVPGTTYRTCNTGYTPCATIFTQRIDPCNIVCVCDYSVPTWIGCPGAFPTSCNIPASP